MRSTLSRRHVAAVFAAIVAVNGESSRAGTIEVADATPGSAEEVMGSALANRYDLDTRQIVDLVVRNRAGEEQKRRLRVASKRIDGRLHSLGRFEEPIQLRGTTILSIENSDRSDDHFVFLPSLHRVRRVTSAQRADSFMGTDLSFEDFERRRIEDYSVRFGPDSAVDGEPVSVIVGTPHFDSGYDRVDFLVAKSDLAILEMRFYRNGRKEPHKVLHAPRADTRLIRGHVLPTRLLVENFARGTETEVWIRQLAVNPELDDGLFTSAAIEVGRPIPGFEP